MKQSQCHLLWLCFFLFGFFLTKVEVTTVLYAELDTVSMLSMLRVHLISLGSHWP